MKGKEEKKLVDYYWNILGNHKFQIHDIAGAQYADFECFVYQALDVKHTKCTMQLSQPLKTKSLFVVAPGPIPIFNLSLLNVVEIVAFRQCPHISTEDFPFAGGDMSASQFCLKLWLISRDKSI